MLLETALAVFEHAKNQGHSVKIQGIQTDRQTQVIAITIPLHSEGYLGASALTCRVYNYAPCLPDDDYTSSNVPAVDAILKVPINTATCNHTCAEGSRPHRANTENERKPKYISHVVQSTPASLIHREASWCESNYIVISVVSKVRNMSTSGLPQLPQGIQTTTKRVPLKNPESLMIILGCFYQKAMREFSLIP